jgi:FHS family glucose/mannose:H+ symporter-like MFS transporter
MPASAIATPKGYIVKGSVLAHLDFVLTGIVMTLLGPMLPVLSTRWSLDDTQAGYLFIAQWTTSVFGMMLSGVIVQRYGYRIAIFTGMLFMALGIAARAVAGWPLGVVTVCVFGFGFGVSTPATNLFIADANPGKRAAALNLLNSSWGLGALACPFMIAAAQRAHRSSLFLYGTAAALVLLAVCIGLVRFAADARHLEIPPTVVLKGSVWTNRWLPVITALFFIYVGTETCIGGWIASYARRVAGPGALWAMTPSFFWGALLAGRALAPIALRWMRETRVAAGALALAVIGVLVLLMARTILLIEIGALISGFGLASIFPINVSLLTHWFGHSAKRLSGVTFPVGNFGGAVLPWLVGLISTHSGSLRIGLLVPFFGAVLMLGFYASQARGAAAPART